MSSHSEIGKKGSKGCEGKMQTDIQEDSLRKADQHQNLSLQTNMELLLANFIGYVLRIMALGTH